MCLTQSVRPLTVYHTLASPVTHLLTNCVKHCLYRREALWEWQGLHPRQCTYNTLITKWVVIKSCYSSLYSVWGQYGSCNNSSWYMATEKWAEIMRDLTTFHTSKKSYRLSWKFKECVWELVVKQESTSAWTLQHTLSLAVALVW